MPAGADPTEPIQTALDLMVASASYAPAGASTLSRREHGAGMSRSEFSRMAEDVAVAARLLAVLRERRPCVYRALKLWAQVP